MIHDEKKQVLVEEIVPPEIQMVIEPENKKPVNETKDGGNDGLLNIISDPRRNKKDTRNDNRKTDQRKKLPT